MQNNDYRGSRRHFLRSAAAGALAPGATPSAGAPSTSIYAELGVRTVINGRGVATFYSGTLMPAEVQHAMARASEHFVEIVELQKAVGARLARFAGTESAIVCSGSAACISQATAGCIAGTDADKIAMLPDTTGMRNEVIITQRSIWDRSIALAGAKLVLVQNLRELEKAINPNTVMIEMEYGDERNVKIPDAIAVAKRHKVPFLLDAATVCPPFERLKTIAALGADMFNVSGGKGLFGPQCTGVLFGRKHLIEAALRNGSPYEGAICRPMKVGKEEIIGILAAYEWSSKRDYRKDCKVWESRMQHIVDELASISGVRAEIYYRTVGNEVPYLALNWDERGFRFTAQQLVDELRAGDPQIEVIGGAYREVVQKSEAVPFKETPHAREPERMIAIASNTLKPGEEAIIARRLKSILGSTSNKSGA